MDEIKLCEKHSFPMVELIDKSLVCSAEYLDEHIGNSKVVDIFSANVKNANHALVFDSGAMLPLLCACCQKPSIVGAGGQVFCPDCKESHEDDVTLFKHSVLKRSLKYFVYRHPDTVILKLTLNGTDIPIAIPTALKSVRMLYVEKD